MSSSNFAPGKHVLLDLYGAKGLSDIETVEVALAQAALACGATVLDVHVHGFGESLGVTGVALLAESHISIHTWPENDYAAIDIFMCGNSQPEKAIEPLVEHFSPAQYETNIVKRGTPSLKKAKENNVSTHKNKHIKIA